MSVNIRVKVTKEIITNPECGRMAAQGCLIWWAIKDLFESVYVSKEYILVCLNKPIGLQEPQGIRIYLPGNARKLMYLFDKLHERERSRLKEIEFEIPIPDEIIEQIDIEALRPLLKNHPTLELV